MELKTKGAGGGEAAREVMDSNTSLPSILTPEHFPAVSAICFDSSDFACTCFSFFFFEDVEKKVGLKSPKLHTPR